MPDNRKPPEIHPSSPPPPMPIERPTPDADRHHPGHPGEHDPRDGIDPNLPPEPGNDPNP